MTVRRLPINTIRRVMPSYRRRESESTAKGRFFSHMGANIYASYPEVGGSFGTLTSYVNLGLTSFAADHFLNADVKNRLGRSIQTYETPPSGRACTGIQNKSRVG